MERINYSIYKPCGNDTALVYGTNYTQKQKKIINNIIMKKHKNIEQVGFINTNNKNELQMAGNEFCGNATRSATFNYLKGLEGQIQILVNSTNKINAGITKNKKVWCEIPIFCSTNTIIEKEDGIFIVKMKGITIIVIKEHKSKKYLNSKYDLKQTGKSLIKKYHLENDSAVGVMFCEKSNNKLKINPIVWVKNIDTLFYETACGSGSTAVSMVEAFFKKQSQTIDILQPSGFIITATVNYSNHTFLKATISGDVYTDGIIYQMDIEI